jgi:glycosyltransferase involved in cell wall biosynthesis
MTVARPKSNIEILIITKDEQVNIPHSLASVAEWADAVHVVDSGSTDKTCDIAREMGATVTFQPWLGYARQKNWALSNIPWKSDWLFILDADESITPELRDEILAIAAQPADHVRESGYYVNRVTYFLGKPIWHCGYFPSYNLRFFRRGQAKYEDREVHEHMMVDGPTARLRHLMRHEDRRGLEHFIAKHNWYSTLEAKALRREAQEGHVRELPDLERGIAVRRWLKRRVLPKLPVSAMWRFFYMYFFRLGILDGATGFRFCLLVSTYDLFISLKLAESRAADLGQPIGPKATFGGIAPTVESTTHQPTPELKPAAIAAALPDSSASAAPKAPAIAPAIADLSAEQDRAITQSSIAAEVRHPLADQLAASIDRRLPRGDWPALNSVPVSILVPVKNEQRNIVECLRRCLWATELVVVDSQSTDQTIPLSQALGAEVYQFNYDRATGWPKKKNWALDNVPWKSEWVMILDADEYMTPELAHEIKRVVEGSWRPEGQFAKPGCGDGYWVNRRFMFMGRWIKGCGYYPSWNVRLLKHKLGRYERIGTLGDTGSGDNEVHEHITLSTGKAGYLEHEFLHYAYPDLSAWIEKHNRYTSWEAHAMEAKDEGAVRAKLFGEPIERRRWIKRFGRKLPFRPSLRFLYSYFLQRGFMDGYPGLVMSRLLSWYEFVSIAKYREKTLLESARARRDAQDTSGSPTR